MALLLRREPADLPGPQNQDQHRCHSIGNGSRPEDPIHTKGQRQKQQQRNQQQSLPDQSHPKSQLGLANGGKEVGGNGLKGVDKGHKQINADIVDGKLIKQRVL